MTLAHRIPNPPAIFVGRDAECTRLRVILQQSPVAYVCGPGGIGKSALVRRVLRAEQPTFPADDEGPQKRQIRVSMESTETLADVVGRLDEALRPSVDVNTAAADTFESLCFDILTTVEFEHRTVLVDNLHHAEPNSLLAFCTWLSDYALNSRWVLVARQFPDGMQAPEQLLCLAPLVDAELRDLAIRCRCPMADIDTAVVASGGSPLRLRQWIASRQQHAHLDSAPVEARALLAVLARLEYPLALDDARRLTNLPSQNILAELEESGWLQQSAEQSGLRMHDVLAVELQASLSPDERAMGARGVASLSDHSDPAAVAAAVVATLDTGDNEALQRLLERQGQRLIERGRAAWLWRLLTRQAESHSRPWAFKAAVEARSAQSIAWLAEQARPSDPGLLVLWLEGQLLNTRPLAVIAATETLPTGASTDQVLWLQLQRARALMSLNHMEAVVEVLSGMQEATQDVAAVCNALLARAYLHLGEQVRALAVLRQGNEITLNPRLRSIVDEQRNFVVMASGDASDGQRLVSSPETPNATTTSRLLLAAQYLMRGNLNVTRKIVGEVEAELVNAGEQVLFALVQAALAMLDVRLPDCRRHLDEAVNHAGENKLWMLYHSSVNACMTLTSAMRMDRVTTPDRFPDAPPAANNDLVVLDVLQQFWHLDLHGASEQPIVPDVERVSRMGTNSAARALTEAMWARMEVIEGRFTSGDLLAVTALRRARDGGWPYVVGSALHELALTAAGRGDRATFRKAGDELRHIGEAGDMALYSQLGGVFEAMVGPHPDMPRLDALAAALPSGPAGFWARGAFGHSTVQRAYDRAGLQALGNLWTPRLDIGRTSDEWEGGWGFDAVAGVAWRLNGARLKLTGRVARRLLTCLVRQSGSASKESLVNYAWDHNDYHPLRDDNRLHVAMRRLRRSLDGLEFSNALLETTDDGYCISTTIPFSWAVEA